MRVPRKIVVLTLVAVAATTPASADSFDVWGFVLRTGSDRSPLTLALIVILLMVVNYLLNLLVIGVPAKRFTHVGFRRVSIDLVFVTVLGQLADRAGAYGAALLTDAVRLPGFRGEGWAAQMILSSFAFSGVAIATLAMYFLRRRWQVAVWPAVLIAIAAAVLTNPVWAAWFA